MTDYDEDRREYERVSFHRSAVVRSIGSDRERDVELLDISLKGVLLECPRDQQPESDDVEVVVELTSGEPTNDPPRIELTGTVVHREKNSFGVTWDEIDAESMGHLRRLLELNLDYDELQREIAELVSDDEPRTGS